MHHSRTDYDFDVISGPSTKLGPPPAPPPRPAADTGAAARPADGTETGEEA